MLVGETEDKNMGFSLKVGVPMCHYHKAHLAGVRIGVQFARVENPPGFGETRCFTCLRIKTDLKLAETPE